MKIVLVSNYYNHHQQPLSEALYRYTEGNYFFIETRPMRQERKQLGYGLSELPSYVKTAYKNREEAELCRALILEADVVIAGSAPEDFLKERMRTGKLLLRYGERPLKQGPEPVKYLPRLLRWHLRNLPGKPIYLLAASAYGAADYAAFGLFRNRVYRWGYFPSMRIYSRLPDKEENSILWVGRFLHWKHPEDAIYTAANLRAAGYAFCLRLIGTGPMETQLHTLVSRLGLEDQVLFLGAMPPEQVREHMERSAICLCTSDRQEGWGAVVNEAMNSGCAVVAGHAIGAVPWLIRSGENGVVYRSEDRSELTQRLKYLLEFRQEQTRLGTAAYETITQLWNADVAAKRVMAMADALLQGKPIPVYEDGPCSRAENLKESWYGDEAT